MLALLHPIISDCHCIVFDRSILSAFVPDESMHRAPIAAFFFSITRMTFTGDLDLAAHLSLLLFSPPLAPLSPCFVLCGGGSEEQEN